MQQRVKEVLSSQASFKAEQTTKTGRMVVRIKYKHKHHVLIVWKDIPLAGACVAFYTYKCHLFLQYSDSFAYSVLYKDNNVLRQIQFFFKKKSLVKRFEQITSIYYQVISHTENQNLQFFFRSR